MPINEFNVHPAPFFLTIKGHSYEFSNTHIFLGEKVRGKSTDCEYESLKY